MTYYTMPEDEEPAWKKHVGANHTHKKILAHSTKCGACGDPLESFRAYCVFYKVVMCKVCYEVLHKLNPHHKD